jgi:integrase/recombinase XerD
VPSLQRHELVLPAARQQRGPDQVREEAGRRLKERRDPIVLPEDRDIERVIARAPGLFAHLIRADANSATASSVKPTSRRLLPLPRTEIARRLRSTCRLTGCRQDELVTLERRHVDLSRRAISVLGKGNKRRAGPSPPGARRRLGSPG